MDKSAKEEQQHPPVVKLLLILTTTPEWALPRSRYSWQSLLEQGHVLHVALEPSSLYGAWTGHVARGMRTTVQANREQAGTGDTDPGGKALRSSITTHVVPLPQSS